MKASLTAVLAACSFAAVWSGWAVGLGEDVGFGVDVDVDEGTGLTKVGVGVGELCRLLIA